MIKIIKESIVNECGVYITANVNKLIYPPYEECFIICEKIKKPVNSIPVFTGSYSDCVDFCKDKCNCISYRVENKTI